MKMDIRDGRSLATRRNTGVIATAMGCVLVFAASVMLRSWNAASRTLWNDEAFSWAISRGSLRDTIAAIAADFHPPGYYLMLWGWQQVVGDSVFALRLMSVVAGSASVVIVSLAARRLCGWRVGLTTAVLLAVHPSHVLWSQIARGYALLYLFSSLAMLGATEILVNRGPRRLTWGWVLFVVGSIGAIYTHNVGVVLWGTLSLALFAWHIQVRRLGGIRSLLFVTSVVALAYAPWAGRVLAQAARIDKQSATSVYVAADWGVLGAGLVESFFSAHLWAVRSAMLGLTAVLAACAFTVIRKHRMRLPMALCLLVPPVACVAGYLVVKPVFAYLFLASRWYHLFASVLCAAGLVCLVERRRWLGMAVGAVFFALASWSVFNVVNAPRVPWDELVRSTIDRSPEAELIAADANALWAPLYYASRYGREVRLLSDAEPGVGDSSIFLFATGANDPNVVRFEARAARFVRKDQKCLGKSCVSEFGPRAPGS